MNEVIKKFEERRAELVSQSEKSNSVEEFRNLQTQIQDLNTAIEELKKVKPADERTAAVNDAEKRSADSQKFVQGKGFVPAENRSVDYSKILETREKAGQDLKEKRAAQLPMAIFGETRAVTVGESSIVVPTTFSNTINPDFNKVSTLIDSVDHLILNGGESFRQPYIKDIEIGGYTLEGENAVEAETKFDYLDILKVKATSYSEVSEELLKLPSANYADKVFQNIRTSMRMLLTKEILVGGGNNNQLVGVFSDKATAIDSSTDLEFSTVDDQTLDTIVFSYGGDENVEDPAVLILSKEDLLEFARVSTSTTLRYYDIKTQGNFGTINSVPFIINSACKPLTKATTATGAFCMCYGALSGYTLVEFSPMQVKQSDDFKFRESMTAFKGTAFIGGNVTKHNAFLRVRKTSS